MTIRIANNTTVTDFSKIEEQSRVDIALKKTSGRLGPSIVAGVCNKESMMRLDRGPLQQEGDCFRDNNIRGIVGVIPNQRITVCPNFPKDNGNFGTIIHRNSFEV